MLLYGGDWLRLCGGDIEAEWQERVNQGESRESVLEGGSSPVQRPGCKRRVGMPSEHEIGPRVVRQ